MGIYNVKVHGFMGCGCMGGAIYEDALVPVELSDDEVGELKAAYKGKKVRSLDDIETALPQLHGRITEEVFDRAEYYMEHRPLEAEIFFLPAFRKLSEWPKCKNVEEW